MIMCLPLAAFLLIAAGRAAGEEATLSLNSALTTAKDLATAEPMSGRPIPYRNLQDCVTALENLVVSRFADIPGGLHSCKCGDPLGSCNSVFPEVCASVNCSVAECLDSVDSVEVCFRQMARTFFTIDTSQGTVAENSRSITTLYTRGVSNVCDQIQTLTGFSPGNPWATDCAIYWDLVECNSCTICAGSDNPNTRSRSIDCSNIDPDAIDTDCVPQTDNVDFQVLKFNSSAVCTSFPSHTATSSAHGFLSTAVALFASVACLVFTMQIW